MSAPEIAVAYVSIVPSLQGFQQQLRRDVVGPSADAGADAGTAMGAGLKGALKAGAAAAAIAAGAVIAQGLSQAIEQAHISKTLQAQLGASGKDAARYGKIAGKLYTSGVTENFQEGADAIKAIMQSGIAPAGATNKQLQSIATKATDVSKVFGQDLGGVTRAVSQMMKTGLAKNSGEAFDLITRGFQKGVDKGDDFLDTINEYGTQFRKAGLDGETAIGLMNQAIRAGARDSDIAADAIKEFSIRAVDGSKLTKEGFKALGLNADSMAAKFAKGGKSASGALDTTLDKLRAIKDPVKRSAAAVALFGTQAEDLGDALFAMDPSKAAAGLGKVGGAADKVGTTIRKGPMHEIQTFTRSLQQGLVTVLGTHVIPAIGRMINVIKAVPDAARGAFAWLSEYLPYVFPFAVAIGGLTLALSANAIATGAVAAVMTIYRTAIAIGTAVTVGFTAVQAALNAVMALNPFVLVAIAIAALVAGMVVAYQKSDTFRAIVQAAWKGIKDAAMQAWAVIKPIVMAFAQAVMWLYTSYVKPFFSLIVWVFKTWWAAVKLYFSAARKVLSALGTAIAWLYNHYVKPFFRLIGAVIRTWWSAVKLYFRAVSAIFTALGRDAKRLYTTYIKPAFAWIASRARWVYQNGIKPSFDRMKTLVRSVGFAFNTAKNYISKQWSKLSGIAKKPISFIVNTVYNKGIVGVWNKVASAFGAPKLKKFSFATGGIMPGYTPGRDPHKFYSPTGGALELSGGEAIMRPEVTRALGVGTINRLNGAARSGGVGGVRSALGGQAFAKGGIYGGATQRFAKGGVWGWVKNASSSAWDKIKEGASWLKDGIKSSAMAGMNKLVKPLIKRIGSSDGLYSKMVKGIPTKMMSKIFEFGGKADKKMESMGIGGKGTKAALRWARTQNGKNYQWGGNGNPSWDCSGFTSAIESVIRGQKPHRRWSTHAFKGGAPPGWVRGLRSPYQVGITHSGVGHVAGTLNGVNVESRGGGVHVGGSARGARNGLFSSVYGFAPAKKYDNGGWLQPGATMSVNKTGKPEPILTASQWSTMATLAGAGATGGLQAGDRLVLVTGSGSFEAYVDQRAGNRIEKELSAPARLGRTL